MGFISAKYFVTVSLHGVYNSDVSKCRAHFRLLSPRRRKLKRLSRSIRTNRANKIIRIYRATTVTVPDNLQSVSKEGDSLLPKGSKGGVVDGVSLVFPVPLPLPETRAGTGK